jgi:hypothetical protein
MSGQPLTKPNDAQKFREQYLANLEIRARLDDINLQANKKYLRTGSLPVEVNDYRTTEEKLRDKQYISIRVNSALKEIMTGNNAQRTIAQLTANEREFYSQAYEAVNSIIRPQYKLGVLAEIFVPFLRKYMADSQNYEFLRRGLQQTQGTGVLLNGANQLMNEDDLRDLELVLNQMNGAERALDTIQRLKEVLPPRDIYDKVASIDNPIVKSSMTQLLNLALQEIPSKASLRNIMIEIETAFNLGDSQNTRRVLNKVNGLFTLNRPTYAQLAELKSIGGVPIPFPNQQLRRDLYFQEEALRPPYKDRGLRPPYKDRGLTDSEEEGDEQDYLASLGSSRVSNTGSFVQNEEAMSYQRLRRANELSQEQQDNRPDALTTPLILDLPSVPTFAPPSPQKQPAVSIDAELADEEIFAIREDMSSFLNELVGKVEEREVREEVSGFLNDLFSQVGNKQILEKLAIEESKKLKAGKLVAKSIRDYFKKVPRVPVQPEDQRPIPEDKLLPSTLKLNNYPNIGLNVFKNGEYFKPLYNVLELDMNTIEFNSTYDRIKKKGLMDIAKVYRLLNKLYGNSLGLTPRSTPPVSFTGGVVQYIDKFVNAQPNMLRLQQNLPRFLATLKYPSPESDRPKLQERQKSIEEFTDPRRAEEPEGKGMRGSGLNHVSYPFGKYTIKGKFLNDDIVNLQYKSQKKIKNFPNTKVSSDMGKILRQIAGGGVPEYNDMEGLTQPEKVYLHKLAKESDLIGRFSIPTPDKTNEDKEKDEFNLLKGQILSGNDNEELVKKFKSLLIRLSTRGELPKTECREILMDLVAMGY